jgi:molybdopterin molybdotransferase
MPGLQLRPADLGLIASLGIGEVEVRRRLRVAFFSTGDELASIGRPLAEGEVYDSNRYTLHGMLSRLGVEILDLGVVRDKPALLEAAFRRASASADAVITTGGVSVGEADFIRQLMAQLGEVLFWKIAMRPGRPMAFGRVGNAMLFGLPGNPVAVMVTFYQFVREALLFLGGRTDATGIPLLHAASAAPIRKVPGRTEYQRGILYREGDAWKVRTTGQQGSGVLRSMSEANCFIVLEHGRGNVAAGEPVQVQLFEGLL